MLACGEGSYGQAGAGWVGALLLLLSVAGLSASAPSVWRHQALFAPMQTKSKWVKLQRLCYFAFSSQASDVESAVVFGETAAMTDSMMPYPP